MARILTLFSEIIKAIRAKLEQLFSHARPEKEPPSMDPVSPSTPQPSGFLSEVAAAESQTPLPPPPPPMPRLEDPKYSGDRQAYEQDKRAAEAAAASFATAAKARGAAVGGVISKWLASMPYAMFQELLEQPKETMPIFKPAIGPVVIMRHAHVIKCLERTDTVHRGSLCHRDGASGQ